MQPLLPIHLWSAFGPLDHPHSFWLARHTRYLSPFWVLMHSSCEIIFSHSGRLWESCGVFPPVRSKLYLYYVIFISPASITCVTSSFYNSHFSIQHILPYCFSISAISPLFPQTADFLGSASHVFFNLLASLLGWVIYDGRYQLAGIDW